MVGWESRDTGSAHQPRHRAARIEARHQVPAWSSSERAHAIAMPFVSRPGSQLSRRSRRFPVDPDNGVTQAPSMPTPAEFAAFAEELARIARDETLHRWAAGCGAQDKGGGGYDPVTDADREAERAIRDAIEARYPDHGVTGEEWPDRAVTSAYSWSLDPVDGTRSFICGLPTWVTLIAHLEDGRPAVGLIDAPCLDEIYVGLGDTAWMIAKGERTSIRTSGCASLSDVRLSTTDPFLFEEGAEAAFDRIRRSVRTTRYGHDGYAYARLAAGSLDLVIESGLKPHDYNALIPVVRGAGGAIGDWRGGDDFARGKVIAAATRQLYDEAVGAFEAFA
jgi:histidinol phosphatase-like enzyme (inositol monophosphatase family)